MANTENNIRSEFWKQIEKEFMQTDASLKEFASNKELAYSTVYKWSCRNNWIKKREIMRRENLLAGKVDFDTRCASTLMKGMDTIDKAMEFGIDAKSTPALMRCIRDIQEGMYRLMDVPLPKQRIETDDTNKTPIDEIKDTIIEQIRNLEPSDLDGLVTIDTNNGQNQNGNGTNDE